MTVITYSSAAGRLQKEIQVPPASGNVPQHLSEFLEPGAVPGPSENPVLGCCGVRGQRRAEERNHRKAKEGAGNLEWKRRTWSRGVNRERTEGELCNVYSAGKREIKNDLEDKGRKALKGKDKKTDVCEWSSVTEEKHRITKRMRKKMCLPLKHINEDKMTIMGRRHHIFICLLLLILSLCAEPTLSQVRMSSSVM